MDRELLAEINRYRKNLASLGVKAEKIVLFGSRARGGGGEYSDIDLLVVSDDFERMDLFERLSLLGRACKGINVAMDVIGYTESELKAKGKSSFVVSEVLEKGTEVPVVGV
ncbi:MAG: nucleotidyltransferase domain-containing protein [Actinobacteria bacterium]|nr:nucleotidyltransferase domain-containing protein [Actinomycetota bacterium]